MRLSRFARSLFCTLSLTGVPFLGTAAILRAQTVLSTITTGATPAGLAVNPLTNTVYVMNTGSSGTNSITVINALTGATSSLNTPSFPQAVAVNPVTNTIYVTNRYDNSVAVINGSTNTITTTITVGTGPDAIAVNPVTNMIYTANWTGGTITVINGATNAVVTTLTAGTNPRSVAVNPVTNMVYVTNYGSSSVTTVNSANHTSTISVGAGAETLSINTVTDTIYVANASTNTVSVINGATGTVSATLTVGSGPWAIATDTVTGNTYVACINTSNVYGISPTNTVTSISGVGAQPSALAVDQQSGIVYVSSRSANTIIPIPEATNIPGTPVTVGTYPVAMANNPITHQLFVSNANSNNVTQLSSLNHGLATITVGATPKALAEANSKIYVVNNGSGTVTPITESTNIAGTAFTVGTNPTAIAADSSTGDVYVSNTGSNTVSVISSSGTVSSVAVGSNPGAIAADPVVSKAFVANPGAGTSAGSVSILTEASVAATVTVGTNPTAIGVNPVTGLIYVANAGSNTASIISATSNTVIYTDGEGASPSIVAVDPITNMIYIGCPGSHSVSVVSGTTHLGAIQVGTTVNLLKALAVDTTRNHFYALNSPATGSGTLYIFDGLPAGTTSTSGLLPLQTVAVGTTPSALYVNNITGQIYVANAGSNTVSIVDPVTFAVTSVATGTTPAALAMSADGHKLYAANGAATSVTLAAGFQPSPLVTTLSPLSDTHTLPNTDPYQTSNTTPSFTVAVNSNYTGAPPYTGSSTAINPPATNVYYQLDSTTGHWLRATVDTNPGINPSIFATGPVTAAIGSHTLYAFAATGYEAGYTSNGVYTGNSPEMGDIHALPFTVVSTPSSLAPSSTTLASSVNPVTTGSSTIYTATVNGSGATPTGTVEFFDGVTLLGSSSLSSGVATYTQTAITAGFHAITAQYMGNGTYSPSNYNLLETTTGLSTPPAIGFASTSSIQSVFDYATMRCDTQDIPDDGARAYRDYLGKIHLSASHSINRQMIGSTLDTVTQQCPILYQNDNTGDPSQYDDNGWLETYYTFDGNTIFSLNSQDYHPYRHPSFPQCDDSPTNTNCWYSTIVSAMSTDGGYTFSSPAPGQARFVAGASVVFDPTDTATVGALIPSNIIPLNSAYYMFLGVQKYAGTAIGNCLLRTTNLADPTSWRAWDGTGFNIQFLDPYTNSGLVPAQHECTPVDPTHLTAYAARSLMQLVDGGSVVGYLVSMQTSTGVEASVSSDLIHWSNIAMIASGFVAAPGTCTASAPITGDFYGYPAILDSASTSMNFNSVNIGDATTWVYMTQFINCPYTWVRNLIRIPVTITH